MFSHISNFFIKNSQLSFVFVVMLLLAGIISYIILPKQYNPSISLPAFQIYIENKDLDIIPLKNTLSNTIENSIFTIPGVEYVYGTYSEKFAGFLVQFYVGETSENAKIKLYQKLSELSILQGKNIQIKSINPDDLSQITYSISYLGNLKSEKEAQIYLQNIALEIQEKLKTIQNVSEFFIVGGGKNSIYINFNKNLLKDSQLSLSYIEKILKQSLNTENIGEIETKSGERIRIKLKNDNYTFSGIEDIVLSNSPLIRVKDIAEVELGGKKIQYFAESSYYNSNVPSIFFGISKKIGSNSVTLTKAIQEKINELKKDFPSDISIQVIQNEGEEAEKATNLLVKDLIESIGIVVIILVIFLGRKNALNTATSIPLILSGVFFIGYILGFDINRISLFALILVIGMLVDDSIVVVENIHRHLEDRVHTKKSKKDAILSAVEEVGSGVILSTITKILSFIGMFAVTGMMGEYMGPIPKFAILALILSIFIAFIINPWISYITETDSLSQKKKITFPKKYDIRIYYQNFLKKYISQTDLAYKKRKQIKRVFWILLFLIITLPVYFGVFKARMLPKSDKNQIYLWIDAPRNTTINKSKKIDTDIRSFLLNKDLFPEEIQIIESIHSTVGTAFMGDFANLFRGGLQRNQPYQISYRINLIPKEVGKDRKKSEDFVIQIRPYIDDFFMNYPIKLQYKILEDPPGPPVQATFMARIHTSSNEKDLEDFAYKVFNAIKKIKEEEKIVDLYHSLPTLYPEIQIKFDETKIKNAGFTSSFILQELSKFQNETLIGIQNNPQIKEESFLSFGVGETSFLSELDLKNIVFTNSEGKQLFLRDIATFDYQVVPGDINTYQKNSTVNIYAEMGENSVIYPIIRLYKTLTDPSFLGDDLEVIKKNFYEIQYKDKKSGELFTLLWDGEWKLTMDTFRDLGSAMIISLLIIYFLMVTQFGGFGIAGIIMLPFLFGFFGIFPGFSLLYMIHGDYFNATGMIGIISLGGIVVGNAILLIDYINIKLKNGFSLEESIIEGGMVRLLPILLTSISAIFGAIKIVGDPVWSGLAWSIVFGLSSSATLTLFLIPIWYYENKTPKNSI